MAVTSLLYVYIYFAQTYTRLNKVGICLSHKQTLRIIDKLAEKHDHLLRTWKTLSETDAVVQPPVLEAMTPMSTAIDSASQSSQSSQADGNQSPASKGVLYVCVVFMYSAS